MTFQKELLTRRRQVITSECLPTTQTIMFKRGSQVTLNDEQGRVVTELVRLNDLDTIIGRVNSTGHRILLEEADNITFLLPAKGRLDIEIKEQTYRLMSGRVMAFRPTRRDTKASPNLGGSFAACTLQIPMRRIRALEDRLGIKEGATFPQDGVELSGPVARYLAANLLQLVQDLVDHPEQPVPERIVTEIGYLLDEQICELIGTRSENQASRRILPALHRVRLAEEIMHLQSDEPISVLDMAEYLGVSMRSLQIAFNQVYGKGPREVLNDLRLEKARSLLLQADGAAQVTAIALDCGFSHLSRFSQAYARTFGEKPSETLMRRRA